jgi:hypothetical protein
MHATEYFIILSILFRRGNCEADESGNSIDSKLIGFVENGRAEDRHTVRSSVGCSWTIVSQRRILGGFHTLKEDANVVNETESLTIYLRHNANVVHRFVGTTEIILHNLIVMS